MTRTPDSDPAGQFRAGVAGGSARAEHRRRREGREARARDRLGTAGVMLARVTGDPQSTRAWDGGSIGEERVGRLLDAAAGPALRVLHDRRIPGTRANLDHLVVTPTGVHVVDTKRYVDQRAERRTSGPFGTGEELLYVGRRDKTALVLSAQRQAERVTQALGRSVPVIPVLCFVHSDWPLLRGPFRVRGVIVTYPRRLIRDLDAPGALRLGELQHIQARLAAAFPAYVAPGT